MKILHMKLPARLRRSFTVLIVVCLANIAFCGATIAINFGWKVLFMAICFGISFLLLGHAVTKQSMMFPRYYFWKVIAEKLQDEFEKHKDETGAVDYQVECRVSGLYAVGYQDRPPQQKPPVVQ